MRENIIRFSGDLKREVWGFSLIASWTESCIFFESYSLQTRRTIRCRKWQTQAHWSRLNFRGSNIEAPLIPIDVDSEMRSGFQESIKTMNIKGG